MPFFFCRLLPPRPSFAADMTGAEAAAMQAHAAYLAGLFHEGVVALYGPVADPAGPWGLGVLDVPDEAAARAVTQDDPVIRAGLGFRYEVFAMPRAVTRARLPAA